MQIQIVRCPSCGASVHLAEDQNQFFCSYCRGAHVIERSGGAVIARTIEHILAGTDRVAAELALVRLEKESVRLTNEIADLLHRCLDQGHDVRRIPDEPDTARPTNEPDNKTKRKTLVGRLMAWANLIDEKDWLSSREVALQQWSRYDAINAMYQTYAGLQERRRLVEFEIVAKRELLR